MSTVRRRQVLGAAVATTLVLGAATLASATTVTYSGGVIIVTGTPGNDTIGVDVVPGVANPFLFFYEISARHNIPDQVPAGCFRKDAKTLHCPVQGTTGIQLDLQEGNDTVNIGEGIDVDLDEEGGTGNDNLEGGDADDDIDGAGGNDVEKGGKGNDKLIGDKGKDKQIGGPGRDVLNGGPGDDRQNGGGGGDTCNGGPGREIEIGCEQGFAY